MHKNWHAVALKDYILTPCKRDILSRMLIVFSYQCFASFVSLYKDGFYKSDQLKEQKPLITFDYIQMCFEWSDHKKFGLDL